MARLSQNRGRGPAQWIGKDPAAARWSSTVGTSARLRSEAEISSGYGLSLTATIASPPKRRGGPSADETATESGPRSGARAGHLTPR